MEQLNHVNAVWFLQQENFVDILEHDLVVMSFSMQLAQIRVKVE
jgi:hypothetical protein